MIACVVPTVREDRLAAFRSAWADLFARHRVTLVVVRDGDEPTLQVDGQPAFMAADIASVEHRDLFFNHTDSVRNWGFLLAARIEGAEYILTLDDDVEPPAGADPIAEHLSVLGARVPESWLNTAPAPPHPYLRGVPYGVRHEAEVMLSHGVWTGVPDFDAPTQLQFGDRVPERLPYHAGPIPSGVWFAMCGMNVMVKRAALPYLYYAPMGPGAFGLNRFGDIWCGLALKLAFDRLGWAVYTGASTVVHTRASDVYKNLAQEAEGLRLNETAVRDLICPDGAAHSYWTMYQDRRVRYAALIASILEGGHG